MVGQYNNNCYWPLILKKKWKTFSRVAKLQNGRHQLLYISFIFLVILAIVTLGQSCPVSHPGSPGWSWFFTVVYSLLDSLLRVSQCLLNSFLYLGKLQWFPSLGQSYFYKPSVITLRYVGDRISWKTWCWNKNDGPGAEMSSRASSCLVYYILWRVNLSKLSRKNDNNN